MKSKKINYIQIKDLKGELTPFGSGKYETKDEAIKFIDKYNLEQHDKYEAPPEEFILVGIEKSLSLADDDTFLSSSEYKYQILKYPNMVSEIALWMLNIATQKTYSGNYHIYDYEICDYLMTKHNISLNASKKWLDTNRNNLLDELDSSFMTLSETWLDKDEEDVIGFDLNLCLNYCPNAEEE